ncbi:hypothetical protein ACIBI4_19105 [Streptomyces sp. NPDC050418]|uniref:hypothetical protein n=1 Tax=Streptomyces sp. NPDC050418 TaxID=3365612 RepID=UPI003792520D
MGWSVPERVQLKIVHELQTEQEPGLVRSRVRETTVVVPRPEHGEAQVPVECGHCHRAAVFVIQDLETTRRLRRIPVVRSLVASVLLIATVVWCAVLGFGGGNITFQVLTLPAGLIFLPLGIALAVTPSGKLGVTVPKGVTFDSKTKREGLSYVTRSTRRGEGVACIGMVAPAP